MLIVLLSLAGGVLAGTPLHAGSNRMGDCCIKAKSKENSREAEMARECCATNCNTSAPTSSIALFNFAPADYTVYRSMAEQIAALFPRIKAATVRSFGNSRDRVTLTLQPRYIQYNSFLI